MPPESGAVAAFFRVQIEAAKDVQRAAPAEAPSAPRSLDRELRPAIARVGERMAWLAVRVRPSVDRAELLARVEEDLAPLGLGEPRARQLADAIAALGPR